MMKYAFFAVLLLSSCFSLAQGLSRNTDIVPGLASQPKGQDLSDITIDQKLNSQVPLDLSFVDENGNPVTLQKYFTNKPVILNLVYYQCAMLCPEVLHGITDALKSVTFKAGKDYEVVTVSFDPRDTPAISAQKKAEVIHDLGDPGAAQGWHFLTGPQASIQAITKAVGFHYRWDPDSKQFLHATGIMVLTPKGKISKYFYGVSFKPADLRFGLIQASNNRIGNLVDAVLLFCCRYNPRSGKYDWLASRLLSIGGAITVIALGSFLIFMYKTQPKHSA